MNLRDIKFLGNFASVYWKVRKPNPLTVSFLTSFIYTPTFARIKKEILDEFDSKIDPDLLLKGKAHEFNKIWKKPANKIYGYLDLIGLSKDLSFNLALLIYANTFIDLQEEQPYIFYAPNTKVISLIAEDMHKRNSKMGALLFWQSFSKQQLIDWVNNHFDEEFKGYAKPNLPNLPFYFDKFKDLEICDYIYSLDNKGESTDKIIKKLEQKFPKKTDDFTYFWVLNKLNRYKKRIAKYSEIYKIPET